MGKLYNIEELKSVIRSGAKIDKYSIEMTLPLQVISLVHMGNFGKGNNHYSYDKNTNSFRLLAHSVNLPTGSMQPVIAHVRGQKIKLRGTIQYDEPLQITCYLDPKHSFKVINETWMKAMDNFDSTGIGTYFPSGLGGMLGNSMSTLNSILDMAGVDFNVSVGYMTDIKVSQLSGGEKNSDGSVKTNDDGSTKAEEGISYYYKHCFPIGISAVNYDAKSPNQIASITVSYAFSYCTSDRTLI